MHASVSDESEDSSSQPISAAVHRLVDCLIEASRTDEEVRRSLLSLADYITKHASETAPLDDEAFASATKSVADAEAGRSPLKFAGDFGAVRPSVDDADERDRSAAARASLLGRSTGVARTEPIFPRPALTLGQGAPWSDSSAIEYPERYAPKEALGARVDLDLVARRLRMKADGSRWAAQRRRLLADAADYATLIEPNDRETIRRAKEIPGCYLWTNGPNSPTPADLSVFEVLAKCYDNCAAAVELVRRLDEAETPSTDPAMQRAFHLLAESQSALRVAAMRADGPEDSDQFEVFQWLKTNTRDREIYVSRHMRVNDPADPGDRDELGARIAAFDEELGERQSQSKKRKKALGKVKHKAQLIAAGEGDAEESWNILLDTVQELIDDGMPPSNRELRESLIDIVESLPDSLNVAEGSAFDRVLREIDRFLAENPEPEPEVEATVAPEVEKAKELLGGRAIMLIGGERRADREKALREALGLSEIYWMKTSEQHQPLDQFEPLVAKEDVACVVLMIRWSRHGYGDVKQFCDRHKKPLVRLPGGYGVNQIAKQILDQVGGKLEAMNGA
jgi:hypothetical protein